MAITPKDIAWGSYQTYEGPFYRGKVKYVLPGSPTEGERRLRVLTATEGGCFDAINMYDRCVISVGLIQWCEAQYYLVSRLLHSVAELIDPSIVIDPLRPALEMSCAEFKKNSRGQWRFFFRDERGEVDTLEKQQQLFLGCDGKKGSWTEPARMRARLWASCMANVWQDERAQRIQSKYTVDRLMSFLLKEGREILFDASTPDGSWVGALRAAYLSYAGNLPAVANKHIQVAAKKLKSPKWSPEWCIGVLQELTFGPGIAIYPHRYEAIRPWLERLWPGVTLPKTSIELKAWVEPDPIAVSVVRPPSPVLIDEPPVVIESTPVDMPSPEEPKIVEEIKKDQSESIVLRPPVRPNVERSTETPEGVLGWILYVLGAIMGFFLGKKKEG